MLGATALFCGGLLYKSQRDIKVQSKEIGKLEEELEQIKAKPEYQTIKEFFAK